MKLIYQDIYLIPTNDLRQPPYDCFIGHNSRPKEIGDDFHYHCNIYQNKICI